MKSIITLREFLLLHTPNKTTRKGESFMIDEGARLKGYNTDDKPSRDRNIFKFCYLDVPDRLRKRHKVLLASLYTLLTNTYFCFYSFFTFLFTIKGAFISQTLLFFVRTRYFACFPTSRIRLLKKSRDLSFFLKCTTVN